MLPLHTGSPNDATVRRDYHSLLLVISEKLCRNHKTDAIVHGAAHQVVLHPPKMSKVKKNGIPGH